MKKVLVILFVLAASISFIHAQTCSNNPFLANGSISPSPLAPGGTGIASFTFNDNMGSYDGWQNDPITVTMCFLNIAPTNGVSAISGNGAGWFTWIYNSSINCLQGTQNQTTNANTPGNISVNIYQTVPKVCGSSANSMGYNINLQPAACMNGTNSASDDATSSYTCVAPTSVEQINKQLQLDVAIYPNPTASQLNINITNGSAPKTVFFSITNLLGSVIKKMEAQEITTGEQLITFNVSDLADGAYFLGVQDANGKGGVVRFTVVQ